MRKSTVTRAAEIKQISLLIADDASIIRRALRRMLQDISELSIVGDCPEEELISQARKFQPDVALIDVVDPTVRHVELTKSLREELRQVIANLCSNAIDAMPFGGQLTLRVRSARDWRGHGHQMLRISIADTGSRHSKGTAAPRVRGVC